MRRFLAALGVAAGLTAWLGAQPANHFRFALLGDRTGDADQAVYEQVWREVDARHPDFVLNVGDSIQGGNDATVEAEWKTLWRLWDRYKQYPQYFTPGNHDIWSNASRTIYERETGHPASYGFDFGNAHFTVLDNSGSLDLSDGQMQFLEQDLTRNRSKSPKFVVFHQPFWLLPVKLQSGEFPFHQLAKKYGVNYVFSGHGHEFVRAMQDGIVYLEAGSSGGKPKGQGFEKGWFYGYTWVEVDGQQVKVTIQEIGPPFGQGRVYEK